MTSNPTQSALSWFATTAPGLEPVLQQELLSHGIRGNMERGGIEFQAPMKEGVFMCQTLRCPSKLWLRLATGPCHKISQVGDLIRKAKLTHFIKEKTPINMKVSVKNARLHRRDIVNQKASRVCKGELQGENKSLRAQTLHLRIVDDQAVVSIDAGGGMLHKRGWRAHQGKASLRENWAANLLIMAGWEADEELLDPFCGAGTIPIEAARIAEGLPPHIDYQFAFQDWKVESDSIARPRFGTKAHRITGYDRHAPSVAMAIENAVLADVSISFRQMDISDAIPPSRTGLMVANPPYGIRLGQRIDGLYQNWGKAIKERFPHWRGIFLCPHPALARRVHSNAKRLTEFENGGIRVGVWIWDGAP